MLETQLKKAYEQDVVAVYVVQLPEPASKISDGAVEVKRFDLITVVVKKPFYYMRCMVNAVYL